MTLLPFAFNGDYCASVPGPSQRGTGRANGLNG
jgi:hypothetical protein